MKLPPLAAAVALLFLLAGCATSHNRPQLQAVRSFATASSQLNAFAELSLRYRDTYQREQPYLTAEALQRERAGDATRRAAYADFIHIKQAVTLYMQTLGQLAGEDRYALSDQARKLGNGIKAWPGSGLNDRHVAAYTVLARVITQTVTSAYQEKAVGSMVADGGDAMQSLLDAMVVLLRLYDKSNDNERQLVLGVFEVNLPFATSPQERLLATLGKVGLQEKTAEYTLVGRRYTLTANQLRAIAAGHERLVAHLARPADPAARDALADAAETISASRLALDAQPDEPHPD